ncbi:MAG: hypothetical protein ACWGHH_03780 [Sulfurovaceae bacterium]
MMSFERSLKATLVAVVHTQVCAIRKNDAFLWLPFFSKKKGVENKDIFSFTTFLEKVA